MYAVVFIGSLQVNNNNTTYGYNTTKSELALVNFDYTKNNIEGLKIVSIVFYTNNIKTKLQSMDATGTTTFTVVYDLNNHDIVISINNPMVVFVIPTDGDLIKNYGVKSSYDFALVGVPFIDTTNLNSWNDLIGNVSTLQQSMNAASASIRPFVSGMLDLLTIRNIYINILHYF